MRRLRLVEILLILSPFLGLPAILFAMSGRSATDAVHTRAAKRTLQLVVVTPHPKAIQTEFELGFQRWLWERDETGVEMVWVVHNGSTALRSIREEFEHSPDGIGIDLLFGAGIDPYEQLKAEGRLTPFKASPTMLDGIPSQVGGFPLYDPDGTWYATCMTGFGVMINRRVFEVIPSISAVDIQGWEDLADPRLLGWVGSADPRTSSSSHTCFEILLQAFGFEEGMELIRRIGGNVRAFSKNSSAIPRLCAIGEVACGLTMDFFAYAQIDKVGDVIEFALPAGNTVVNGDAAGMLRGGKNREAAELFMEFLLSEEAARLWMLRKGEPGGPVRTELNRGAVRPAIYAEVAGRSNVRDNPFGMDFKLQFDPSLASRRWNLLNDLIGAVVIDVHSDLRAALGALNSMTESKRRSAMQRMMELPLTEAEMHGMIERWDEPEFRALRRIEWTEFARTRYREVTQQQEVR